MGDVDTVGSAGRRLRAVTQRRPARHQLRQIAHADVNDISAAHRSSAPRQTCNGVDSPIYESLLRLPFVIRPRCCRPTVFLRRANHERDAVSTTTTALHVCNGKNEQAIVQANTLTPQLSLRHALSDVLVCAMCTSCCRQTELVALFGSTEPHCGETQI